MTLYFALISQKIFLFPWKSFLYGKNGKLGGIPPFQKPRTGSGSEFWFPGIIVLPDVFARECFGVFIRSVWIQGWCELIPIPFDAAFDVGTVAKTMVTEVEISTSEEYAGGFIEYAQEPPSAASLGHILAQVISGGLITVRLNATLNIQVGITFAWKTFISARFPANETLIWGEK